MAIIEVETLYKEFTVVKKKEGLAGAFMNLFRPEKRKVTAVKGIDFSIERGEIVGFIGPNGAGKSTTIKLLSGILHPTSGTVRIEGISPHKDRISVVKKLGVVFGQRSQLHWDRKLGDSFHLLKMIYQIDDATYNNNLRVLNEVIKINEIIDIPVRMLSLGQRMRGDLAAALLHSPSILFLDEPTIGLDAEAKHSIRKFITEINRRKGVTVILTTHDLDDVEELCSRLIVLNNGKIVEDAPIESLIEKLAPYRVLVIETETAEECILHPMAEVIGVSGHKVWFRFDKKRITAAQLIADLIKLYSIKDLSVQEPNIEDVIRDVYKSTSL